MSSLAVSRVGAEDARQYLVMLHGIYGRGRNWQSIARGVAAARPTFACWLIDLPYHGDSGAGRHGDTVSGLATDVREWLLPRDVLPAAMLGHSYGGKVALAFSALQRNRPLQTWVIDSTPEVKEPSGSAWAMLELVRRLPQRFSTRDEAINAIVNSGYDVGVAQWMATNLARSGDDFTWRLDFDAMERLLRDFFRTDLWHVVERPAPGHEFHFVKASDSSVISEQAVTRLQQIGGPVHVHQRQGGHWIHAESPDVVTALLVEHLPASDAA